MVLLFGGLRFPSTMIVTKGGHAFGVCNNGCYVQATAGVSSVMATLGSAVSYMEVESSSVVATNGAVTGSTSVTMVGGGMHAVTSRAHVGGTQSQTSVWVSATSVVLKAASATSSAGAVSAGMLVTGVASSGTVSNGVSYDAGYVQDVMAGMNVPKTGATSVTIVNVRGVGIGSLSMVVGGTSCGTTTWVSSTSVRGKGTSGYNVGISTSVTISGRTRDGTLTSSVTFDAAAPSSAVPTNGASTGSTSVTVVGGGLSYHMRQSSRLRVLGSSAEGSGWVSSTSIQLKASIVNLNGRTTVLIVVTSPVPVGTLSGGVTFNADVLAPVANMNSPTTGAVSVTMVASTVASRSISGRVGGSTTEGSWWTSSTMIVTKGGHAFGVCNNGCYVQATAGVSSVMATLGSAVSYTEVESSSVVATNGAVTGSTRVTLVGHSFAVSSVRCRFYESLARESVWMSVTSVVGKTAFARVSVRTRFHGGWTRGCQIG